MIVNERLAGMFWPDQDPIGKGVRLPDSANPIAEVVGLVKDNPADDVHGRDDLARAGGGLSLSLDSPTRCCTASRPATARPSQACRRCWLPFPSSRSLFL